MDSSIIAALISGGIAIIGVFVSVVIARWQIGLQKKELDLKAREIDTATKKLLSEVEALRQTQFTEILKRRLDVYPDVWSCVFKYTIQWRDENKERNHQWAKDFIEQLNVCNAKAGVYFSQAVYERFNELQVALVQIETKLIAGKKLSDWELLKPDKIFVGENHKGGLATFLKDDLGSYRNAVIQARTFTSHNDNFDDDWEMDLRTTDVA